MASAAVKITVDEFLALPEIEDLHRELVHGEIWEEPLGNAGETHEIVKSNLLQALSVAAGWPRRFRVLVESSFRFREAVLIPDVSLLIQSDPTHFGRQTVLTSIPDIAIEIVSSDSATRLMEKIALYRESAVSEIWVLYPRLGTIAIYTKNAVREVRPADTLTSALLPGFALPLSELFS
ncbi:MAG: Uma2 family endonuclease [Acidobacteria bacterium]|nr:Uma2 family endonuclease [Acidobacteriota bacterium]